MNTDTLIWQLVLQLVLIAANAVFACAEVAVVSMNDARLAKLASEKNKNAMRLEALTKEPSRFLSTIQVAVTISGFLAAAFAANNFSEAAAKWVASMGADKYLSMTALNNIAVVAITVVLVFVTLVFGEFVPRKVAMKNCEKMALGFAGMLTVASVFFAPFVWLLSFFSGCILRLMGIDPDADEEEVTEEEIRMMVDAGMEKGTIDSDEKEFIQNVFEFDDTDVGEICTHRKDVEMLWMEDDMTVWSETINNSIHSKFPVCRDSADDVIGILDAKDYFRLYDKSRQNVMVRCVEEPQFVLETTKADIMFEKMKKSRNYIAVVLDEYGGMCGIITLNDLVQQIMGELVGEDEEEPAEDIEKITEGKWRIMGDTAIKDVCQELNVSVSDDEYDTFGGFIFGCLGSIPDDGSRFEIEANGMKINVEQVKDHCVVSAVVTLIEKEEAAATDEE